MSKIVDEIGRRNVKPGRGNFCIGDTVDVHYRIVEGDKERIQVFTGTVIARRGGGENTSFTVRRLVQGQGVERVFPLHSPKVDSVEVKRTGRVRRAKLHYLRGRIGKATRLPERRDGGRFARTGPETGAEGEAGPEPGIEAEAAPEAAEGAPEGAAEETEAPPEE